MISRQEVVIVRSIAAIVIGLSLLILALITKGKLGGADIKLMMAVTLTLGLQKSVIALMVGSFCAVFTEGILLRNKGRFAFIPYLTIGILGQLVI